MGSNVERDESVVSGGESGPPVTAASSRAAATTVAGGTPSDLTAALRAAGLGAIDGWAWAFTTIQNSLSRYKYTGCTTGFQQCTQIGFELKL